MVSAQKGSCVLGRLEMHACLIACCFLFMHITSLMEWIGGIRLGILHTYIHTYMLVIFVDLFGLI